MLYLSREDVEDVDLSMIDIINALEDAFLEKGEGRVEMPPKPGIHPKKDSFIHAMPAYVPNKGAAGLKWVSGFPDNVSSNLPYISGLLILNDPNTGLPLAVMDCTWITAKRTGAATAVAAKYLARNNSKTVGIIACGVQGRSNLEALSCVFELDLIKAYDILPGVVEQYANEMGKKLGLEIVPVKTCREAITDSDIVVTSGPILKNPEPLIDRDWLNPGSFACPLDFDSYWSVRALEQIDRLATDDLSQLNYYRTVGYFSQTPQPYADLGEIIAGKKPGRTNSDERTLSLNLGLAIEDVVTAVLIYQKALALNIGTQLEL